jgi:hypothetical protein
VLDPDPASVLTVAVARATLRILLPYVSHTYKNVLVASMARPWGRLKVAANPTPSEVPVLTNPARIATIPPGEILRMQLLFESETYSQPHWDTTRPPSGPLNPATVPMPSTRLATPLPAKVVTAPEGAIILTL